jgi:hypothetical protein
MAAQPWRFGPTAPPTSFQWIPGRSCAAPCCVSTIPSHPRQTETGRLMHTGIGMVCLLGLVDRRSGGTKRGNQAKSIRYVSSEAKIPGRMIGIPLVR